MHKRRKQKREPSVIEGFFVCKPICAACNDEIFRLQTSAQKITFRLQTYGK